MIANQPDRPISNNRLKSRRPNQTPAKRNVQPRSASEVLFLRQSPVVFEAPTQKESVFFDECNREIISLTSGIDSKTRVLFQSAEQTDRVKFLLPVEKRILSIKLNPTKTILAYHVEKSNIEFINVSSQDESQSGEITYELESRRYVQSSRARNAKLSGFLWTGPLEMVMITDISVEYYHVEPQRHRLKHVKSFPSSTNWFVYQPSINFDSKSKTIGSWPYSMLVVSTGSIGNSMQPYMFMGNQVIKLQKFDVEGSWHGNNKLELFERSITIAFLYGSVRLLVLQHESLNIKSRGAQILIYTIDSETSVTSKTHTLDLDINGRFAINVVDNLVIAHDQPSRSSFVFDIMIDSTEKSDCPRHHVSLLDGQPIRGLVVRDKSIEMYSLNWVFFQPNFIIDAKMGLLCTLHLDLACIRETILDNQLLLTFLAHRANSETVILDKICEIVNKSCKLALNGQQFKGNPLAEISASFDILANLVVSQPELDRKSPSPNKGRAADPPPSAAAPNKPDSGVPYSSTSISQEDIHKKLFQPLESSNEQSRDTAHVNFVISTLLEFIFMVRRQDKNVDFRIYESLLRSLALGGRFYQAVQMIRSGIFRDSKQLACVLLSFRGQYKPAAQLGIDMLNRLDCLTDLVASLKLNSSPTLSNSEISGRLSDALNQSFEIGGA